MSEDVPGSDVATLRRLNTRSVLGYLTEQPDHEFTVSELAVATQLSRPTVSNTLNGLVDHGWVRTSEGDSTLGRAGRPARHFRFARDAGVCVGVDAGPHSVAVLVADLANDIIARARLEFDDLGDPRTAVDAIEKTVRDAVGRLPGSSPVFAISVAVPGVVAPGGGLRESVVVPRWVDAGLDTEIARRFPQADVSLGNDVKLAAVAELSARDASAVGNFLYLSIGRRISAGIVMGGTVQLGATGAAGELGASPAIAWGRSIDEALSSQTRTLRELVQAARDGDAAAREVAQGIGQSIAEGVTLLALAVDPEVIVLAGPGAQAGEALAGPIRAALSRASQHPPTLDFALIDTEPSARGAVEQSIARFRLSDPLRG